MQLRRRELPLSYRLEARPVERAAQSPKNLGVTHTA